MNGNAQLRRRMYRTGIFLFLFGGLLSVGSFGACTLLPTRWLVKPGSEHSNFRPPNSLAGILLLLCLAGLPVVAASFILLVASGLFRSRSSQEEAEVSGSSADA